MSGKSENIIELKHISKVYSDNGFKAVDDFNLEVKRGEFVTFLGPSGCGKTTTLRMIAGFELPTDGQILLNGEDISQLPANKRPINTVFQRYALFPHMNIYENIAFGLKLKKLPKEEIRKKVKHVLDMVDLEGFLLCQEDSSKELQLQEHLSMNRKFLCLTNLWGHLI